ncbi:MAG: nuclear transport factor 2 family protein [Ginsengibacter sp.]
MDNDIQNLFQDVYNAFNKRDIPGVLKSMAPDVRWPNGWEGGYVNGRKEVRDYWTRQWAEVDPKVTPISINKLPNGSYKVDVHQLVKDLNGKILFDGIVQHIYTMSNGLITTMEIVKEDL